MSAELRRSFVLASKVLQNLANGHNYIGHNYIGHNYISQFCSVHIKEL